MSLIIFFLSDLIIGDNSILFIFFIIKFSLFLIFWEFVRLISILFSFDILLIYDFFLVFIVTDDVKDIDKLFLFFIKITLFIISSIIS